MKNIAYAGAVAALVGIDMDIVAELLDETFSRNEALRDSNQRALRLGYDFAMEHFDCPLAVPPGAAGRERRHDPHRRQHRDGARLPLRRRDGRGLVSDHAGHRRDGQFHDSAPNTVATRSRATTQTPSLLQEQLPHHSGRGRDRLDRDGARRGLERRARLHLDVGPGNLADERAARPRLLHRDPRRHHRRPARRPLDGHADAHPARRHLDVRLRLARRHEAHPALPGEPPRVL